MYSYLDVFIYASVSSIFRSHRLHIVHRCGLLLQILYVACSACLCIRHTGELGKNDKTDRDAIWVADS